MGIMIRQNENDLTMYEIWVDRLACVVHEDDILEMVEVDTFRILAEGEPIKFKLVEVEDGETDD